MLITVFAPIVREYPSIITKPITIAKRILGVHELDNHFRCFRGGNLFTRIYIPSDDFCILQIRSLASNFWANSTNLDLNSLSSILNFKVSKVRSTLVTSNCEETIEITSSCVGSLIL